MAKAVLKLSLRGQDPEVDYYTLTRDLFALRAMRSIRNKA